MLTYLVIRKNVKYKIIEIYTILYIDLYFF